MTRTVPSASSASVIHGLWFVFQHPNQQVALWVSSLAGMQELYVNGALMTKRRKILLNSTYELQMKDALYSVSLSTKNLLRGSFQCVLSRKGTPLEGWEAEYVPHGWWKQVTGMIVGAALITYAGLAWNWTPNSVAFGVLAASALSFAAFSRRSGYEMRPLALSADVS